jgi:hypothetical protein
MSDRRDRRPGDKEPAGHVGEFTSRPCREERGAEEKPGGTRVSVIGRLPKFFGWWLVIAGFSSYV